MSSARKIVHIDCDSFYASIEVRDNPTLTGLPVAVGGAPERRGVIATCNYLARQFGVHSAMASSTARKRCPNLVIIRPDITKYRKVSQQIHNIFKDYTALIEPLSLDEAYLDLSENTRHGGSASLTASEIRQRIAEEVRITVSAGIAPNKFLAKVASDWNKPDGQLVIGPDQVDQFVRQLPVDKLFGVGKVTAGRLHKLGIHNCGELRLLNQEELDDRFGSFGKRLYELCRGIDQRPVQPSRIRKSVSVENTFAQDLPDLASCLAALPDLMTQLQERMRVLTDRYRVTGQVVKIKFHDFVSTTVESKSNDTAIALYQSLLKEGYQRGDKPVRLLGIGARLTPADSRKSDQHPSDPQQVTPVSHKELQMALLLDQGTE